MKTCLNRLIGRCKDCKADYEPVSPAHPANNLDCKNYYEVKLHTFRVVEEHPEGLSSIGKLLDKL
jgi:hypothetical protein